MKKKKRGGAKLRQKRKEQQQLALSTRRLRIKDPGEEYAQVLNAKGNCRFDVRCNDEKRRLAHIRGSMRRTRIFVGDIVLVSLRLFEKNDDKCDIVYKYTPNEVRKLWQRGEITEDIAQVDKLENASSSSSEEEQLLSAESKSESESESEGEDTFL